MPETAETPTATSPVPGWLCGAAAEEVRGRLRPFISSHMWGPPRGGGHPAPGCREDGTHSAPSLHPQPGEGDAAPEQLFLSISRVGSAGAEITQLQAGCWDRHTGGPGGRRVWPCSVQSLLQEKGGTEGAAASAPWPGCAGKEQCMHFRNTQNNPRSTMATRHAVCPARRLSHLGTAAVYSNASAAASWGRHGGAFVAPAATLCPLHRCWQPPARHRHCSRCRGTSRAPAAAVRQQRARECRVRGQRSQEPPTLVTHSHGRAPWMGKGTASCSTSR